MNVSLVDLCIAALAVWQIVEIWHHSSLFATKRARVELMEGFFGQLLSCPWCLSVWVAWVVGVVVLVELPPTTDFWNTVGFCVLGFAKLLVFGFAVSRLANLGNDLAANYTRTPNRHTPWMDRLMEEDEDTPVGCPPDDPNPITTIENSDDDERDPTVPFNSGKGPPLI